MGDGKGTLPLRLRDDGRGLPAELRKAAGAKGSGTRISPIAGLAQQGYAEADWSLKGGTSLQLGLRGD